MTFQAAEWRVETSGIVTTSADTDVYTDDRELAHHIARHDPARVLAEVEAKRQLLDLHAPGEMEYVDGDVCMACDVRDDEPFYPCITLRLFARVWRTHPDFDPAWLED